MDNLHHIVIAMNPVMGLAFIRQHNLPHNRSIIVCSKDDVAQFAGYDVHNLAFHVAGDMRSIQHDTEVFQEIVWATTTH